MKIAEIRKALVPVVVGAITALLAKVGIGEAMTVGEALTYGVTAGFTYLIPNRPRI